MIPQVQIPDFTGTLQRQQALTQQGEMSRLQALALQQAADDAGRFNGAIDAASTGLLAGSGPAYESALTALLRGGQRGVAMALPLIQQRREEQALNDWRGGGGSVPAPPTQGGDPLLRIAAVESGGNDGARNPNSTATGRFQIVDGTWNAYAPRLGLTPEQRNNPQAQERVARAIQEDATRALGRPLTPGESYGAHFLGIGGLQAFTSADPNADAFAIYSRAAGPNVALQAFRSNPGLLEPGMTVGQVMQALDRRMTGGGGGGGQQPPGSRSGADAAELARIQRGLESPYKSVRDAAAGAMQMLQLRMRDQPTAPPIERLGAGPHGPAGMYQRNPNGTLTRVSDLPPSGDGVTPPPFGTGAGGASLAFIESLAPKVADGTATPEEVRRYLSAVTEYQQERIGSDGTRVVPRLPPYAPGADVVVQRYGMVGTPQPATAAAPPASAQPPAPGGVPIPGTTLTAEPPPLQATPLPGAAGGVARAAQPPPANALSGMVENVDGLRRAREALRLVTERPESVGLWQGAVNMLPGDMLNRADPGGTEARAMIGDLGSIVVHQRSGAAVTAAEFPRLRPFIPQVGDSPQTVQTKLRRFVSEYESILRDQYQAYGPTSGFRPQPVVENALRGGNAGGAGGGGGENNTRADPLGLLGGNRR